MPVKAARYAMVSLTLAGFSLPGAARASSGSSSSGSSSSGSSSSGSSSSGSSGSATATTAVSSLVATVAGVLITVAVVRGGRLGKGDWGDWDRTERARALLDSGIIDTRSNLGVEVGLVMTDPDSFEQMNTNVADGAGVTLAAVSEAAGLPPDVVGRHWRDTRILYGSVDSEVEARQFSVLFLSHLARDLTVDPTVASSLLWELARERVEPDFPANADTHRWLAGWMGVPLRSAILGTEFAFEQSGSALPTDLRSQIYANPTRYLDRLSTDIGIRHPKEVDKRVRGLVVGVLPWWPADEPVPEEVLDPSDKPVPQGTP